MKLFSIQLLRHDQKPQTLAVSYELSSIGYFQRTAAREMINFISKTIVARTPAGQRASVEHEGYFCHIHVRHDGLAGVVVVDSEYKAHAAFVILAKLLDEYDRDTRGEWKTSSQSDSTTRAWPPLETAVVEYQDPTKVDTVSAIEKELDEVRDVLAQTLDNVLARGEKLDELVAKSGELSTKSKVFYQNARRTNSCCIVM